jgi:hypothetical protein
MDLIPYSLRPPSSDSLGFSQPGCNSTGSQTSWIWFNGVSGPQDLIKWDVSPPPPKKKTDSMGSQAPWICLSGMSAPSPPRTDSTGGSLAPWIWFSGLRSLISWNLTPPGSNSRGSQAPCLILHGHRPLAWFYKVQTPCLILQGLRPHAWFYKVSDHLPDSTRSQAPWVWFHRVLGLLDLISQSLRPPGSDSMWCQPPTSLLKSYCSKCRNYCNNSTLRVCTKLFYHSELEVWL